MPRDVFAIKGLRGAQRGGRPSDTDFAARSSSIPAGDRKFLSFAYAGRPPRIHRVEGELETAVDGIEGRIKSVRGHGVMLDVDLAELYSVKPSVVIQAVRRNRKRYPDDFMFQLTNQELANLKSQSVISSFRFTRCRCHGHSGIDSPNSGGTGQRPLPADRFHGGPGAWGLTPCHAAASPSQRILPDREVSK